jgi:hypothetical protein
MADTPRGPRPTVSRRTAALLAVAWVLVLALLAGAATVSLQARESGWTRARLQIVELPYGECHGDCTIKPTVELPDGTTTSITLIVDAEEEQLPSQHFRADGSLLLWLKGDETPRARQPVTTTGTVVAWSLLAAAVLLAAAALAAARRAPKLHADGRAGHAWDHLCVRVLPVITLVATLLLASWYNDHVMRRYEPILPPNPTAQG